jgi:hypothetical protein
MTNRDWKGVGGRYSSNPQDRNDRMPGSLDEDMVHVMLWRFQPTRES